MGKIRIVLGEDHDMVRGGLRRLLEQFPDFEIVGEAADGQQTLELVERLQPDVLLCDIRMPVLDGIEVIRRVKAKYPKVRALALSAYDDDDFVSELIRVGSAGYLLKTASVDELAQGIRTAYLGEMVIDKAIAAKMARLWTEMGPVPKNPKLTPREIGILKLAAEGLPNKTIASQLNLSMRTVEAHLGRVYGKMGVSSRPKAVHYALSRQIVSARENPADTDIADEVEDNE